MSVSPAGSTRSAGARMKLPMGSTKNTATSMPAPIARHERMMRVRSSSRCSRNDICPPRDSSSGSSGGKCLARPSAAAIACRPRQAWNRSTLISTAALELIAVVGEQDVETGQRPVTATDIALKLHLHIVRQVGSVHLLLERAQTIPKHDDLVEERLDRPALLLQAFCAGAEYQRPPAPFFGRHDRSDTGLFADDATQQQFEIVGRAGGHSHRCRYPLSLAHNGKWVAAGHR